MEQAHRRGVADVGTFDRGQGHPDHADAEAVLGDRLRLRDAQQQPTGARHALQVAYLEQERRDAC